MTVRDLRRSQIVAAARALVARSGLEALTFGALEARLAFTRGVITYHFRDRDEIVAAVLESAVAEIDAATSALVHASESLEEKIAAVLRTKVQGFLERREASHVLLAFWGRILHDRSARERNARLFARYRAQGEALLLEARRAGAVRRGVDAAAVATNLVGAVIGIVAQVFFEPGAIDAEACVREAARALAARLVPAGGGRARARAQRA